jgi:Ni/Fe-hydrogenase 1 B-type cytochrome subunit
MGIVRFTHFVVAFIFIASLLLRTYWAIAGNEWASWRGLFPFLTKEGRKSLADAIGYYFFLRREPPEVIGHNALAGLTYAFIVFLYFVQTFTGFALLGEVNTSGIWYKLTGWIFLFVHNQVLRQAHHLIMWLLIGFALHHVYSAFLVDSEEGNGLMSSIFSGFKFIHADLLKKMGVAKD